MSIIDEWMMKVFIGQSDGRTDGRRTIFYHHESRMDVHDMRNSPVVKREKIANELRIKCV